MQNNLIISSFKYADSCDSSISLATLRTSVIEQKIVPEYFILLSSQYFNIFVRITFTNEIHFALVIYIYIYIYIGGLHNFYRLKKMYN